MLKSSCTRNGQAEISLSGCDQHAFSRSSETGSPDLKRGGLVLDFRGVRVSGSSPSIGIPRGRVRGACIDLEKAGPDPVALESLGFRQRRFRSSIYLELSK